MPRNEHAKQNDVYDVVMYQHAGVVTFGTCYVYDTMRH